MLHTDYAIRRAETRGSTEVLSTRRVRDGGYLREGPRTWEDFAPPELSFPRLLQEAFGKEDAAAIQDALNRAIHCGRSEIWAYRPDLSYTPSP